MQMKEFIVRWTASGYCVEFYYMIVAESLDKAKELWNEYVKVNEDIQYSWNKAIKAVKNHYCEDKNYEMTEDEMKTIRSRGLEESFENWVEFKEMMEEE